MFISLKTAKEISVIVVLMFYSKKVISTPMVKLEGCDYIVSGVVEFYSTTDKSWLTAIEPGNGTCDEWPTKTRKGGSNVFSLAD